MTFYENFAVLCKQKGMTPSRVAQECGINRSNVSNWKKNGYTPRAEDLKKIAEFLHVPVGFLLQTETEREYSSGNGWYPPEKFWDKINDDRARFLHYYIEGDPDCIDEIETVWNISVTRPELASDEIFKRFVDGTVRLISLNPENGEWDIRFKFSEKKAPIQKDEHTLLPKDSRPIDFSKYHLIPILGRISAGLPLYAEEHIEGYTLTDLNGGAEYFALRVHGDSMNALRINDGDIIIVRRQEEVEQGEIAVVMVDDDDATVKRFYSSDTTVTLMPQSTNPEHKPQMYDRRKTSIRVLGLVKKVEFSV